jgi:hypothetical protein
LTRSSAYYVYEKVHNIRSKVEPFIITKHVSYVAGARRFLSCFVERVTFLLFTLSILNTLQDIYVKHFTNRHRQHCQNQKGEIKQ